MAKGCIFVTAIDKFPLIVKSSPGFLVNRVLGPYMMQALQRLERGEAKEKIDEAARAFGMPMGPIELADTVGLDVCAHVGKIMSLGPGGPTKLDQMVAAGKLGKKSGEGFYVWKDGKPREGRAGDALRQVRAGAARPRARRSADPRGREGARREDRRERRPRRCRRHLRHRLCALPRRPAALRRHRAEVATSRCSGAPAAE